VAPDAEAPRRCDIGLVARPRQADVRSQTYCRLLVLRKADFDRFMRANPDVLNQINAVAERRLSANRPESRPRPTGLRQAATLDASRLDADKPARKLDEIVGATEVS
jgi:CRP-like cAMP-binding protein